MKTTFPFQWIVPAILLVMPLVTPAQHTDIPFDKKVQGHHEVPDNPYMPGPAGKGTTGYSHRLKTTGFTMVQVNVDANGQNIVGDAANEPSMAINLLDPTKIVIGWRQFDNVNSNFRQAGYGYSADGGLTWTFPGKINPGIFRSDPVLGSDSSGVIYYNSLTLNLGNYLTRVFRSTDGGATWDAGVDAHGGDKQWMTIDRSGGIGLGNIYSSWTSYYSSCQPGFFTRSTDGGNSYQNCLYITGEPYWGTMTVGNNGELYITGAGSWGSAVVVKSINARDPGSVPGWASSVQVDLDGYIAYGELVNPDGLLGQVNIDVDRSTGPGRDNVYVLASVVRYSNADSADVMFSKSTDGGLHWSTPKRINDDQVTNNYQWFGTMSVAPNGRIDAVWLDTRDSPPDSLLSALYYSYSLDQGETWSANEKLSPLFDSHVGWPNQRKMGDYFDMKSDENGAHLAWTNTLNGEEDVYYSYITIITGIEPDQGEANRYSLACSPNPFLAQTTIQYKTPSAGPVTLSIFTVYGQEIKVLVEKVQPAGSYSILLPGDGLPAGFYLCRLKAGSHTETTRMVRLK